MMLRSLTMASCFALLAGCASTSPDPKIVTDAVTFTNFNKTFWNVSDSVKVGSVVRFEKGEGNFIVAVKYSDFIAKSLPQDKIDSTKDLDQSIVFDDSQSFELAIDLIKPFGGPSVKLDGSAVGAKYGTGKTAKLSFKDVAVQQIDHLPLLIHIQNLDTQKKDTEGAELFNQINIDGKRTQTNHASAKYWIVTKVFTPKEVEWSVNEKSEAGLNFDCNFVGVKCGKLSLGTKDSGGSEAKGGKTLYVVLKPFFTENGVIRIDSTIQATRSVNAS